MKKSVLIGIAVFAVVLGLMIYSSLSLTASRVEVCVNFNGQQRCKTASAASEQDAIRTAVTNACGEIAFGVTDTLACQRAEPSRVTVLK